MKEYITMTVMFLLGAGAMVLVLSWHLIHPCLKYESENVHHPALMQIIPAGKVMIPIWHPAHDDVEDVCVSRK